MDKIFNFENGTLSIADGVRYVEAKTFANESSLDFVRAEVKELFIPMSVREVEVYAFEGFCNLERIIVPARLLGEDESVYGEGRFFTRSFVRMLKAKRNGWLCPNLKTVVVFADEDGVIDFTHYYAPTNAVTYCEGEVKKIIFAEDLSGSYFINSYIEDVEVVGVDKMHCEKLFFRAPKANATPAKGHLFELTITTRYPGHKTITAPFWSGTCCGHSSAVTYIRPIELPCYEGVKEGCYMLILREALSNRGRKNLTADDVLSVVVWEDYATVLRKLREAGWGQ